VDLDAVQISIWKTSAPIPRDTPAPSPGATSPTSESTAQAPTPSSQENGSDGFDLGAPFSEIGSHFRDVNWMHVLGAGLMGLGLGMIFGTVAAAPFAPAGAIAGGIGGFLTGAIYELADEMNYRVVADTLDVYDKYGQARDASRMLRNAWRRF